MEQADRLRELSEKTGVPQAVYLREAVDVVLEKHKEGVKS
jgi:predicted DNA-binding protein